ncbi:MAG: class I SAM-dependent methyltransferase [Candidatus Omnitrophica bacterium]|nr:class I SAM-dependent methyltransferase [Candidatus Omnitrophota bacterium]
MNNSLHKTIEVCRICGSNRIETFLELGLQPPANSLRNNLVEKLPLIPLSLCRCSECSTVQLTETVEPEHLFKHYVWVTGTSSTAKNYANLFCQEACKRLNTKSPFVVEVASNDGTFLKVFKDKGFEVLGVDPAENIVKMANDSGIPTIAAFFGEKIAKKIVSDKRKADFIFARNVIPHVANVHDVVAGMKHCLAADGVGVIEFHYAGVIVDGLQYDSIYHEHLFYFSLKSMQYLLKKHGLQAFDLLESPISGGSLALYFSHKGANKPIEQRLKQKIDAEEKSGLNSKEVWDKFSKDCQKHKNKFVELILKEKSENKRLVGYGSSARSSTLLNYCNINKEHLICIADQNPLKHNKYAAGSDILIISPEEAFSKGPDIIVLLAWNFKTEIISLLKNKYHFCGKVIAPFPNCPQMLQL